MDEVRCFLILNFNFQFPQSLNINFKPIIIMQFTTMVMTKNEDGDVYTIVIMIVL